MRGFLLNAYDKALYHGLGPFLRNTGKRIAEVGLNIQGPLANDDRLVPSLRKLPHNGNVPSLNLTNFVAPNATIKGQVSMGQKSSVWYGAVLRGDQGKIVVGDRSIISDLATLGYGNISIGNNTVISQSVSLSACTIGNNVLVGMGSSIGLGVVIEDFAVVSPGSIVPDATRIPSNQVWAGAPAKMIRMVTPEEREAMMDDHDELVSLAAIHSEENEKGLREELNDWDDKEWYSKHEEDEILLKKLEEIGVPNTDDEENIMEQRVWMRDNTSVPREDPTEATYRDPYEQDLQNFPESFKIFNRNYDHYEDLDNYFRNNQNEEVQQQDRSGKIEPKDREPWTRKFQL